MEAYKLKTLDDLLATPGEHVELDLAYVPGE